MEYKNNENQFSSRNIKCKEPEHENENVQSVCTKCHCQHSNPLNCQVCTYDTKSEHVQYQVPISQIEKVKEEQLPIITNWPNKDHNVKDIVQYVKKSSNNPSQSLEDTKDKLLKLKKSFVTIFDQALMLIEEKIT